MVAGPYLLDTSTMLWALATPERLSAKAQKAVKAGPLILSIICYWEVVIKARKGQLGFADPISWWTRATDVLGGEVLSVRATHVSALASLPNVHSDPFDRMLIAQAAAEGFALITRDVQVQKYSIKTIW